MRDGDEHRLGVAARNRLIAQTEPCLRATQAIEAPRRRPGKLNLPASEHVEVLAILESTPRMSY
jgi:hypothetical protein